MSDVRDMDSEARENSGTSSTAAPNPYAPPAIEAGADVTPRPKLAHGPLKYYYLAATLLPVGLTSVSIKVRDFGPASAILNIFLFLAAIGISLSWSHATWAFMPARARGGVSPGAAITYSFIPFYNFWWAFAFNLRVARSQEAILRKYDTRTRAPLVLAWVAPALSFAIVAFVAAVFASAAGKAAQAPAEPLQAWQMGAAHLFTLVPAIFAIAWMVRVDGCNAEILGLRALKRSRKERDSDEDDDGTPARERMKAPRPRKYERR